MVTLHRLASFLGSAYALSGRLDEALPLLEQAVERATAMGMLCHAAYLFAGLGEDYLLAGRIEDARQMASRALSLARTHRERGHEAYTLRLLGDIAAYRNPPEIDQAEAHYRQALVLADELGMRPLAAHCHLGLGTLYGQTGRYEQARAALSSAIALYRSMEMTFWLPRAEAALAQVA